VGVALFGSLAGDSSPMIVRGLHRSAWIAVAMLLLTAVLAFRGLGHRSDPQAG
jgi:ABC-type proline/glycine betaine transport system permease subunit